MRQAGQARTSATPASTARYTTRHMPKLYIFAAVFLFWTALAASLMQVQLVASPMHKMRVPTYHSMPIRPTVMAQAQGVSTTASYN